MNATPAFENFGERLTYWRMRRGFKKQGDLAEAIGIKQPSLSELEKGHSKEPSAAVLLKLCDVLQLRPRYLLSGEGAPEGQYFQELNGLEAQLVMLFRQLPEPMKDALLIDANDMLNRARGPQPSAANPFAAAPPPPSTDDDKFIQERVIKEKPAKKITKKHA
jgi:transcriptional regulator with XRE-family HTH domain